MRHSPSGYNVRELLRSRQAPNRYRYTPLPTERSIRLLELHPTNNEKVYCSLKSFELERAPPFQALSYTWGYPLTPWAGLRSTRSFRRLDFLRKFAKTRPDVLLQHGEPLFPDWKVEDTSRCFALNCDHRALMVTANLFDALHMLTKCGSNGTLKRAATDVTDAGGDLLHTKYLWVDSVSVDQENVPERNAQVAMMAETYIAAQDVVVWLGPEDDFTNDAFRVIDAVAATPKHEWAKLSYIDFFEKKREESETGVPILRLSHRNWLGFFLLLQRPWFKRAWVVQELALAKSATLICGRRALGWEEMETALEFIRSSRWYHHLSTKKLRHRTELRKDSSLYNDFLMSETTFGMAPLYLARTRRAAKAAEGVGNLRKSDPKGNEGENISRREDSGLDNNRLNRANTLIDTNDFQAHAGQTPKPSLRMLIETHRNSDASDPRDKVIAFLGLADKSQNPFGRYADLIKPDYTLSVQEVYKNYSTAFLLSRKNLSLLYHVQDASLTKIRDLPSWVPDYSVDIQPYPLLFRGNCNWTACGSLEWTPNEEAMRSGLLHVQGYLVDTITETALMPNDTDNSAGFWGSVVQLASTLPDHYLLPANHNSTHTRMEVLWRTLINNTYERKHPAPASCGQLFIDYILNLQIRHALAPWSASVDFQPHHEPSPHTSHSAWHELLAAEPQGSLYGLQLYKERFEHVIGSMFKHAYSPIGLAQLQHEFDVASGGMRRLFRTEKGLLGTGPRSVETGDEIWVLAGAKVPLVLRQISERQANRRLVGETYVHGLMHKRGERVAKLEDIILA